MQRQNLREIITLGQGRNSEQEIVGSHVPVAYSAAFVVFQS